MKITRKQQEEIDFLCLYFGGNKIDVQEYIQATVHGVCTVEDKFSSNSLRIAKTKLDRNIKMWQEGLEEGTLSPLEMEGWYTDPFGKKIVASTLKSTGRNEFQNLLHFLVMNKHSFQKTLT